MEGAEQLRKDAIPFPPRTMAAGGDAPLQIAANPFVASASGSRMGRPLQTAFGEVVRQIGQQTPVVVVVGSAGTGKSMLMDVTARACIGMGLSVRRIERGEMVHTAFGQKSDVLLIDQTDSMSSSSLQTLLSPNGVNIATTMVFLCLPSSVARFSFSGTNAAVVELTPLALSDARSYLQERAASIGKANLFTPEALDLVIDGSRGLPRLLRSIAQLAYFGAASEGASLIGTHHVNNALASRVAQDHRDGDIGTTASKPAGLIARVGTAPRQDSIVTPVRAEVPVRPEVPIRAEVPVRDAPAPAQEKPGLREFDATPTPQFLSPAPSQPALQPKAEDKAPIVVPVAMPEMVPAAQVATVAPTAPAPTLEPNQPLNFLAAKRAEESRLTQSRWISRSIGITGALVVSFVVAGIISSNLTNKNSNNVARAPVFPAASKPVDLSKAVVQQPAPAKPAASSPAAKDNTNTNLASKTPTAADPANSGKDTTLQRLKPDAAVRAQAAAPVRTGPAIGTVTAPARTNRAADEAAARKLAEDKARAEREAGDHIKSAVDQRAAAETTQQEAAAQAASLRAAEAKAAADRAVAERLDAQRLADEKAAADKAAADRAKAAEMAAIQAQQAAQLAQEQQAARQAKAAKDAADKALKEAADREKAEKEADEQYKAERREANRVFSHTLFGFSR
jgi:hypothetical protein